jgi:endonuclease/exonuclease/phosphatase family metal-dependent hydrolase
MFQNVVRSLRGACVAGMLVAPLGGCGLAEQWEGTTYVIGMSQNLYYGTEFDDAIAALAVGDEPGFVVAVTEAWGRVQATDFRVRAVAIADQIEAADPALIGLQEAALWRVQSPSDPDSGAVEVAYDFVEILREELLRRGREYEVASVSEGFDVEFPWFDESFVLSDVRLTDREVVLVRSDVLWQDPAAGRFAVGLPLPGGIELVRGWASVDVRIGESLVRFVTTHLEADDPTVRGAQAAELAVLVGESPLPVILVGDFNYDVSGSDPDAALFLALLAAEGLAYAGPLEPTCCADEHLADPAAVHTERLDLVFATRELAPVASAVLGASPADMEGGLWPSDHAGVVVRLELR